MSANGWRMRHAVRLSMRVSGTPLYSIRSKVRQPNTQVFETIRAAFVLQRTLQGRRQLAVAVKLRSLNVTPAPLLSIALSRCSTIAGNQLDQIGLAAGAGFLKQAVQMCSDRGLGDAEHLSDFGRAIHLDDGKKHAQFRRG